MSMPPDYARPARPSWTNVNHVKDRQRKPKPSGSRLATNSLGVVPASSLASAAIGMRPEVSTSRLQAKATSGEGWRDASVCRRAAKPGGRASGGQASATSGGSTLRWARRARAAFHRSAMARTT